MKGIVIAGTHSGCGKTTVALGLMAALTRRGIRVAPFKVGPDFIDPGHHTRVTGRVSRNLDGWMLSKAYNLASLASVARQTEDADIAAIEGVMGLFDGYEGKTEAGSTAQMAKWLNLPVLLVVDARSMARSAAALVQGFERFDPDLRFAGVIFNRIGSPRHLEYLQEALSGNVKMPILGGIVRDQKIEIPERHLGLFTGEDHPLGPENVKGLADLIEAHIDIPNLLDRAETIDPGSGSPDFGSCSPPSSVPASVPSGESPAPGVRIGIARDNAFCFYYQDNLDLLEKAGAQLVSFSPIAGDRLPENLDGLYLGGGYPELYADRLAQNRTLREEILRKSRNGMPIYGECGGFMFLCRQLYDADGKVYPMTGCFPFSTRMLPRLRSLGYRDVRLTRDSLLGRAGEHIRGHEFHYSEIETEIEDRGEVKRVYEITGRRGESTRPEGYLKNRTLGSYVHLHFGGRPDAASDFVNACREYRNRKKGYKKN